MVIKLKQLEQFLEAIDGFFNPKIKLEQYETGHHIGARIIHTMDSFDDLQSRSILDLGTGCGRLSLACAAHDAAFVLGVDIDAEALEQCQMNREKLKEDENIEFLNNIDFLCADVTDDNFWSSTRHFKPFDIVVMNPPFGTKNNKGIDVIFLKRALQLSTRSVYSLHKTSTRDFIKRKAEELGAKVRLLAELRYDLPKTYRFHKKNCKDIAVDFYRFEHSKAVI
ncbi:Methyltransferase-like protein 5 [Sarcoptes scabiei]|uniref:Methyltransferase-like protein 5 n=1 Tax=Sarcoptes scabiei TaxID=52283 RepID=A0A132AM49_SARSC|nr:Methyltransferase-like protein 5 [Sarcoptes scabiei]KPM12088.1 methyltransferase-like protein 5-like protein [Sarcoptes scabiei]UXI19401.1 60S ribosomal protein L27a-like [Sarcoptes scabiei]